MKILITGSNGLLGQKLSTLLQQQMNVDPIFSAKKPLTYPISRGNFISLDVTDKEAVYRIVSEIKPNCIIHTAAMTQVDDCEMRKKECWLNNVSATEFLVEAAVQHGSHLVHVSTDFIFDGKTGPLDELAIPNPVNYYGESKLAAELAVQKSTVPWSILRTVLVYGVAHDMSRSNIVLWVKKSLEERKPIKVVNDQWRTPTLAEDLAMGCWLAAQKKATGIFNVSGEEMMTPYQIAIRTARHFGLDESLISQTDSTQFRQPALRPMRTGFIIEKAKQILGYQPHTFEKGLKLVASQLIR